MSLLTPAPDPTPAWAPERRRTRTMVTGGTHSAVDPDELAALAVRLRAAADALERARAHAGAAAGQVLRYTVAAAPAAVVVAGHLDDALYVGRSLPALAAAVRDLADDLDLQRTWYVEAERSVGTLFAPPWWRVVAAVLPPGLVPVRVELGLRLIDGLVVAGHAGSAAVALAGPGPAAVVAQRHTDAFARYAQYLDREVVMGHVLVDGRPVPVDGLTPVQRTALAAVGPLGTAGLLAKAGRRLPELRVAPAAVPPATAAAPGAGRPHDPGSVPGVLAGIAVATTAGRPVVVPPRTPGDVLARVPDLERHVRRRGTGAVEVLRTTTTEGTRHWTVVVPGTQDAGAGGPNPMDNETNLLAMAGLRTEMERAVVAALDGAGAARGEPVSLVGHSQGGLVAARLAADPLVAARFSITSVLTAGSPVGVVDVPPHVAVLSLEDVEDPTVGLDGRPNPAAPHHLTVAVDGGGDHPHDVAGYARAADGLTGLDDADVRAWLHRDAAARAAGAAGTTESFVFEVWRAP